MDGYDYKLIKTIGKELVTVLGRIATALEKQNTENYGETDEQQ